MALQSTILHLNKFLPNTPIFSPKIQSLHSKNQTLFKSPQKIQSLHPKNQNNSDLASEFAVEAAKLTTQELQKNEAFKKSKSLLFSELCNYMSIKPEALKKKWKRMSDDDKNLVVKEFVSKWGAHFHPLSAKSVKELVDEHLVCEIGVQESSGSRLLPMFRRLMWFLED